MDSEKLPRSLTKLLPAVGQSVGKWSPAWKLVAALALITLIALAYSNSFQVPFLLDDFDSIVDNPTIRKLADLSRVFSPPIGAGVGGRPLLNLAFALDHSLGGLNPGVYHVTNLCIHIACAGFVFGVVRRTLVRCSNKCFSAHSDSIAWCISALWAVHPLQTISVTYISQRAESLMGLFFLAATYSFIRSTDETRVIRWQVTSLALLTCGILVKEHVAVAPLLFLLYDRAFIAGTFRRAWTERRNFYFATLLLWVTLGTSLLLAPRPHIGVKNLASLGDYLLTDAEATLRYIRLSVVPYPLIFDYGTETTPGNIIGWTMLVCCVVLVATALVAVWRLPTVGFLGAWFFLILAPTTTLVPIRLQPIAENRVYLPVLAVITGLVLLAVQKCGSRVLPYFVALTLFGALGTWSRNIDYSDEVILWQDTAEKRPENARAHINLGFALVRAGRTNEGIGEYHHALGLRPDSMKAHYNLGCALLGQKRMEEAVVEFTKAASLQPSYAPIYNNLGFALQRLGRQDSAIETLRKGVALDPEGIEMNFNLGDSLLAAGKFDEAVIAYTRVIQLRSELPEIYLHRARALRNLHRFHEARSDYREALKRRPGWDVVMEELQRLDANSPNAIERS